MKPETLEKVRRVNELRAKGVNLTEAVKQVGISAPWYWKANQRARIKRPYKKRNKITVTEIQTAPSGGKAFVFYGEPEQITAIIRGLQ